MAIDKNTVLENKYVKVSVSTKKAFENRNLLCIAGAKITSMLTSIDKGQYVTKYDLIQLKNYLDTIDKNDNEIWNNVLDVWLRESPPLL